MVLPAKIFEIKEEADAGLIVTKLKNYHEEESYKTENGKDFNLITEILDLKVDGDTISGVFSKDFVHSRF